MTDSQKIIDLAKAVIAIEQDAVGQLTKRIDQSFLDAYQVLLSCKGRIIVMGIGKSGHIANKISATFASTGSPAFSIHPAEASHGDLGMITKDDVVLVLSNSGETIEILSIIPNIKLIGTPIISLTGNLDSSLAKYADVNIHVGVEKEACPLKLAPTSSTTAALVMGDALAIALLTAKGFTKDDFAQSHPGGALGKKLLLNVDSLMHKNTDMPIITDQATLLEAMHEMSKKRLGHTLVKNAAGKLVGIYTDGDIRRTLESGLSQNVAHTKIFEVMTKNPRSVKKNILATQALRLMEEFKITGLPVVDDKDQPIGLLHMHDILRAGFM